MGHWVLNMLLNIQMLYMHSNIRSLLFIRNYLNICLSTSSSFKNSLDGGIRCSNYYDDSYMYHIYTLDECFNKSYSVSYVTNLVKTLNIHETKTVLWHIFINSYKYTIFSKCCVTTCMK